MDLDRIPYMLNTAELNKLSYHQKITAIRAVADHARREYKDASAKLDKSPRTPKVRAKLWEKLRNARKLRREAEKLLLATVF